MQPPPPRCKDKWKFTQIPYSAAPNPSHHVQSTVHLIPSTAQGLNSRRASREYGMEGARLRLYDIVIPTLTPVLRFPVPPCLPSSASPLLRAFPLVLHPSWPRVVLRSSWLRVVLRPHGPELAPLPYDIDGHGKGDTKEVNKDHRLCALRFHVI